MTRNRIERKTARRIFIGLIILNFIIALLAALSNLLNFPQVAENAFGITYSSDLAILGISLGSNLALTAGVFLLATIWTLRSKIEGVILGMTGSGMLIIFSSISFFQLGDTQGLLVDGIRGFLTLIFGFIAYKELKKSQA